MGLSKYRLGELIEQTVIVNGDLYYGPNDVRGMTITKEIIRTKANLNGTDLSNFLVVRPKEFVYNPRTHGKKIGLGYNDSKDSFLISWNNTAFRIKQNKENVLLSKYLFMHFNRSEWDRSACFNSWGSSTEVFSWDALCDMIVELPDVPTQQKYVDIYDAMCANQKAYEKGLDDLKLTCDAYIEELRRKMPCEKIGPYIQECNEKNDDNSISLFQGVNVDHEFTVPKRIADDKKNGNIVRTGQIAFNKVMKANGTKLPIALREGPDCVVSSSYQVFDINDKRKLSPEYFMLWMNRVETQRYAGFISFGTTRDIFSLDDMAEISIPIPDIKIQESIADIYKVYVERKRINEKIKQQIKNICPILIKGAIEEGRLKRG